MAVKWSIKQLDYEISKDSKSNVVTSVHWGATNSKEVTKNGKKTTYFGGSYGQVGVDSDKVSEEKYKDGDSIPEGKKVGDVKTEAKDPWKDNAFVAYDKLDEDTVVGWVKASLGDDEVKSIEDGIASQIDAQGNPTTGKGKPW
tara:strand:- start:37 stop:465 length:429 start_codon:yes stop_codon:yes gene_type:complete